MNLQQNLKGKRSEGNGCKGSIAPSKKVCDEDRERRSNAKLKPRFSLQE